MYNLVRCVTKDSDTTIVTAAKNLSHFLGRLVCITSMLNQLQSFKTGCVSAFTVFSVFSVPVDFFNIDFLQSVLHFDYSCFWLPVKMYRRLCPDSNLKSKTKKQQLKPLFSEMKKICFRSLNFDVILPATINIMLDNDIVGVCRLYSYSRLVSDERNTDQITLCMRSSCDGL